MIQGVNSSAFSPDQSVLSSTATRLQFRKSRLRLHPSSGMRIVPLDIEWGTGNVSRTARLSDFIGLISGDEFIKMSTERAVGRRVRSGALPSEGVAGCTAGRWN